MDAKLARRPIPVLLVVIDELETTGGGQVHDVGVSAGGSAQLEKVSRRGQLGGKGAAGGMGFDAALGSVPRASDAGAYDFLVFVVQPQRNVRWSKSFQQIKGLVGCDARKAGRAALEARDLEGDNSALDQGNDVLGRLSRHDRGIERHIGVSMLADCPNFRLQARHCVERVGIVIGHVHDGRDTTRHGRAGGGAQAGKSAIAACMSLPVDNSR